MVSAVTNTWLSSKYPCAADASASVPASAVAFLMVSASSNRAKRAMFAHDLPVATAEKLLVPLMRTAPVAQAAHLVVLFARDKRA
jgi:hypothetical protein